MKPFMKSSWLSVSLVLAALLVLPAREAGAAEIKKAPDGCKNAHAILGWSDFKQGREEGDADFADRKKQPWVKMGWIVGRMNWGRAQGKELLKIVSEVEPGTTDQVQFHQYGVKGHDNAQAYVVHCGYGGTCNMLATRMHRNYKAIGVPSVYCGALPSMLENPTVPSIPIPTDEELAEASDDEGWGDDDDDDDDDDDAPKDKKPADKPKKDDDDDTGDFD